LIAFFAAAAAAAAAAVTLGNTVSQRKAHFVFADTIGPIAKL